MFFLQRPKRWMGILLHIRGLQNPPVRAQQLFQQQAEILEKLKNIPQGGQGRNESVESPQGPRACFNCGSHNCPHQVRHDQENWRWAGHSLKWPRPINLRVHLCHVVVFCPMLYWTPVQKQQLSVMTFTFVLTPI